MDPKLPIRRIDYTVIFARQMAAMREFYGTTLGFPLHKELSPRWVEFRIGPNVLALAEPGARFDDPPPPVGILSLQLVPRRAGRGRRLRRDSGGARGQDHRGTDRPAVRPPDTLLS
jgi:catechol 2,3-dioxygenase-like lactoylglutathione lyase family enzyme